MRPREMVALAALLAACAAERMPVPAGSACCPGDNLLVHTGCAEPGMGRSRLPVPRRRVRLACAEGMYMLDPEAEAMMVFHLGDDGVLNTDIGKTDQGNFCLVDKLDVNDTIDIQASNLKDLPRNQVALVCFGVQEDTFLSATVTGTLALVSVGFLVLTLVVYAIVPELRDLQGKCIACTSLCLCFGFFHLAMAQLFIIRDDQFCVINGFLIYFWMLSTFFWMNIASINVMKSVVFRASGLSERRTFLLYSIYGCGMPTLFLIAAVIAENVSGDHLKPGFGNQSCWFSGKVQTWGYFYGPVAILIMCNILLYIVTSVKLWRQTSYENVTKLKSMRYKFLLYFKIFLVMGISWIFEIISYVHDTRHIVWLITDTFNCLQGLVIFLVLVLFRKRALRGLAAKGLRLPCAPDAHTGPDDECDEIMPEEESPALTTFS